MPGTYQYDVEIKSNVAKLLSDMKQVQDRLDTVEGKEYKIKLNVDEKKLSNVISNLEKMLDSLGKGTGDFKQFENLSKELSSIVSEVQSLSKAFGKVDDSGAKTLLSSIKNIDKSLSELSQNILNVNKNMSNMGGNTSGAVKQVENISNAYQNAAKEAEKLADAQSKIGQKTNISSGSDSAIEQQNKFQEELKETQRQAEQTANSVNSISNSNSPIRDYWKKYGTSNRDSYITNKSNVTYDTIVRQLTEEENASKGIMRQISKFIDPSNIMQGIDTDYFKAVDQELQKIGYHLDAIQINEKDHIASAKILPIDDKAITNAEEMERILKNIQSSTTSQNPMNDAFPNTDTKLDEAVTSAKELDKTLEQVDIPTDSFDKVLEKLDRTKSELVDIVKITKQSVSDADGKFHDSYTLKDSRGSTEIYGVNSKTDKGQILRQNIVGYDVKANAKANLENAKNIKAEWDKNLKAIQDYMDAVTKLNNLKAKDKGTGSEANQIALQTQNVEELKQAAWDARKNLSSMQAENPDIIAWKQWVDMMELFDQASKGSAESAAKLKDALNNIKVPSLDKYENKLSSYLNKTGGYDATIARFNDGGWTSDTYLKNVQAVRDAVKQYATLLDNIKTNQNGIASDEDIQNLDKYEKKIKDTIAAVTNMSAAEKGYNFVSGQKELDKIHKLLNENSKMSSEAKAKIKAYYAEIESGNPSMSLDKIHGEILKIYNAEVEAGRAGRTLWDTLKNSGFHQIAAQIAGMFGVYDAINLGKEAISTIVSLDDALVDLKKTTAMNETQLEQYYYDANDVAKQMGVTTEEIINQSSAWSRLGYNTAEASTEMAKLSSQFASISPGMEVDEAQSGLVSIMKAWSINPDQVKSEIMDPINKLGNTMAESNLDIVEGMERSAAALAAVGTSTKDAFALFSGIQEVLQNAEKSGTSLKSVALRLRSFDETTGEYSEDLANITGELIDLTKTAEHAEGVSIFKPGSTTEFKDLTDYFREIAGIWDEMSQKQQNDFLIKAFGRNQAQAGAALIQNFKAVDKALGEMDESAGKFTTRIYSNVYIEYI